MQTVVLAAGRGVRMRPLTDRRPKPMLPVGDRPLLAHVLDAAAEAGASRFVVVVGYEADAVKRTFGDEYRGIDVDYAVQQRRRGPADALVSARSELRPSPFVVVSGDVLLDVPSLSDLYDESAAVGAHRVEDPSRHEVVFTDGDRVTGVVSNPEDPGSDLASVGAYAFPAGVLEGVAAQESQRGERTLSDVLSRVARETEVRPVPFDRWLPVDRPWELLGANEQALEGLERSIRGRRNVSRGAEIRGSVIVEDGATVEPGVVIEGPALVREGAEIGPSATVRGATLVGHDVRIAHGAEVENSVLMAGTTVGQFCYVGDSLVGQDVEFGAGTIVANRRHDGGEVLSTVRDARVPTGRERFGIVCGDGVKTGINTSVDVGIKISSEVTTAPGQVVTGDL